MSFNCRSSKVLAGNGGALETALVALKLNRTSVGVQEQALRPAPVPPARRRPFCFRSALWRCATALRAGFQDACGFVALRQLSESGGGMCQACLVIWNCCANCPDNKLRAAGMPGMEIALVAALRAFPAIASVQAPPVPRLPQPIGRSAAAAPPAVFASLARAARGAK